ncbi:uncharacterized protein [Cicer arietinum]|uniref:Uncharacterized protein LOC101498559 n=1 Tax=Cicer arietinum TaxID=3827 RepID=A0A1S3EFX5_CICAR|nr:uncharacterized protein LOC101498559 [Cicer arietinum]
MKSEFLMKDGLALMREARQRIYQNNNTSIHMIRRVPKFLHQSERFYNYCIPKMISFSPIHHDSENTKEGDHYKLLWVSLFVDSFAQKIYQDYHQAYKLLFQRIVDNMEELVNMFSKDVVEGYNINQLAWMLFVDGCALLHFMDNVDDQCPQALNLKVGQLMYMWKDIILLENQLPTKLLEILCKDWRDDLDMLFENYHSKGACKRIGMAVIHLDNHKPFHILDSSRLKYISPLRTILGSEKTKTMKDIFQIQEDDDEQKIYRSPYKSIRDLKRVGIRVVANTKNKSIRSNILFKSNWFSGELRLPIIEFNDVTPYFLRNLMAFELCSHVPYNYECCSFLTFIHSLVDNAEGVKELITAGVLQNLEVMKI